MKRIFALILLSFLSVSFLVAGDWYVCIGSYAKIKNAENLYDRLQNAELPAAIYKHRKADGSFLYRVLINRPHKTRMDARNYISIIEKHPFFARNNIKGLWIVEVEGEPRFIDQSPQASNEPVQSENKPSKSEASKKAGDTPSKKKNSSDKKQTDTKKTNEDAAKKTDASASTNKPVDTAKQNAKVSANKSSDKKNAKKTNETAGKDSKKTETVSKTDTQKKSNEKSDAATNLSSEFSMEEAEFGDGIASEDEDDNPSDFLDLPEVFLGDIRLCIEQLPVCKGFQIEEMSVCDFQKIRKYRSKYDFSKLPGMLKSLINDKSVNAAVLVTYRSEAEKKSIQILFTINSQTFSGNRDGVLGRNFFKCKKESVMNVASGNFPTAYDSLEYTLLKDGGSYFICGTTADGILSIEIKTSKFELSDVFDFLDCFSSTRNKSISYYPQLRKSLFSFTGDESSFGEFLYFYIRKASSKPSNSVATNADTVITDHEEWNMNAYFMHGDGIFIF